LRFVCDHDIDACVAARLRDLGHEAWTAAEAGLSRAEDDELTAYADDQRAVLLTHDKEFSRRRRRNVIGWHVFLRCNEWDAADVIERRLDEMLQVLEHNDNVWMKVSYNSEIQLSHDWN
jgi:predicted nuclease of predicted toxin-antitoxin system